MICAARRFFRQFVLALLLLALPATGAITQAQEATPAAGTDSPWFVIQPDGKSNGEYFEATIKPGESHTFDFVLGNGSATPVDAITFAADVFSKVNGGFGVASYGTPATGTTTWLDYPTEELTLAAETGIKRSFTVTVPDGTAPGQYITGIVVQTAEAAAVSGSSELKQITRLATSVFITVPGPLTPAFSLGDVAFTQEAGAGVLRIGISNIGNVRVRPEGTVTVNNLDGTKRVSVPVTMGSVYAHDETSLEVAIAEVLPAGEYTVSVELTDPETKAAASINAAPLTVVDPGFDAPDAAIQLANVTLTPLPSAEAIQLVNVSVSIANTGEAVTNTQVVLSVFVDGNPLEDFVIASSLALPTGTTTVEQRYLPLSGWAPGIYSFAVTLQSVDAGTGAVTQIERQDIPGELTVS